MLDICLLGTGGTVPLPSRWLTSLLVRFQGKELLIDCGEGTQIALHKLGFSCKHIDTILLTHFHADHTAGLPGLLLTMAKSDRTEPITIYGPKGLEQILKGISLIARYIPFEIHYLEFDEPEVEINIGDLQVTAFGVRHSVPCYGYTLQLQRNAKFDVAKAKELNVPVACWKLLQKGENVTIGEQTYTPEMVTGNKRKGIKVVYVTDTRPTDTIARQAKDADVFIGEGMYGDIEKLDKAKQNKHSLMQETAKIAKEANVRELWFTHYSPSMPDPEIYETEIHEIFANGIISKDGQRKDIAFVNEEEECSK